MQQPGPKIIETGFKFMARVFLVKCFLLWERLGYFSLGSPFYLCYIQQCEPMSRSLVFIIRPLPHLN